MSALEDAETVAAAARNNAELCDLVSRAHGIDGAFASDAWTSPRRTPMYYPDAVTLDPVADVADVLDRIDASAGASVKDSFATLDLVPHGFRILFSAQWIVRPLPADATRDDTIRWSEVDDTAGLAEWEAAWTDAGDPLGLFRPELLHSPLVSVLRGVVDGDVVAGVITNRSARVLGVSNLFARTTGLDDAWAGALGAISVRYRLLDLVGYESDEMLDAARRAGFRSIGPLRVWIKD